MSGYNLDRAPAELDLATLGKTVQLEGTEVSVGAAGVALWGDGRFLLSTFPGTGAHEWEETGCQIPCHKCSR